MNMTEILDKKDIPEVAGIYCFENTINGKKYIGSSTNLRNRYSQHMSQLSERIHSNKMLQEAYDTTVLKYYIIESFSTGISKDELLRTEQHWIDYYNTLNPKYGYNKVNSYKNSLNRVIKNIGKDKPKRSAAAVFDIIIEEVFKRNKRFKWIYTIWKIIRRL